MRALRPAAEAVAAILLLGAAPATASVRAELEDHMPFELSESEWAEVEAGRDLFLLSPGDGLRSGLAVAVVDSPPERVYEVVTRNDEFAQFMPYVAVSFLEQGADGKPVNYQCLDLPWPISNLYYRVRLTNQEPTEQEPFWRSAWSYVSGNLVESEGSWTLFEVPEGKTRVVYHVKTDPGGGWTYLKNKATKKGLEPLLESVRGRAADPSYSKTASGMPSICESPPG